MLVGGGPVDPSLRERAAEAGVRVVATYGMAETCGGCVYDGLPLDGVGLALAADGRIRLTGPMLFDGYVDDEPATRAALVDGWFVTSDAGRLDEDGRLSVLGRVDDMVVSGGVNVPAAAVGARLREHPRSPRPRWSGSPTPSGATGWWRWSRVGLEPSRSRTAATGWARRTRGPGRRASWSSSPRCRCWPTARSTGSPCGPRGGGAVRVFAIPMTTRFRGITVREGVLIEGEAGWGEWSPFLEYPPEEAEPWLRCAEEAAAGDWPAPVRSSIPVNVTVPVVSPENAYAIVLAPAARPPR